MKEFDAAYYGGLHSKEDLPLPVFGKLIMGENSVTFDVKPDMDPISMDLVKYPEEKIDVPYSDIMDVTVEEKVSLQKREEGFTNLPILPFKFLPSTSFLVIKTNKGQGVFHCGNPESVRQLILDKVKK